MGGRYKIVFWGAILVAAAATFGAYRLLAANSRAEVATRSVVVANRDIPEGMTIDRIALTATQWPVQAVPVGAFASVDSVAGRVAREVEDLPPDAHPIGDARRERVLRRAAIAQVELGHAQPALPPPPGLRSTSSLSTRSVGVAICP